MFLATSSVDVELQQVAALVPSLNPYLLIPHTREPLFHNLLEIPKLLGLPDLIRQHFPHFLSKWRLELFRFLRSYDTARNTSTWSADMN